MDALSQWRFTSGRLQNSSAQLMGSSYHIFLFLLALILRFSVAANRFKQFLSQDVVHVLWLSGMTELCKIPSE